MSKKSLENYGSKALKNTPKSGSLEAKYEKVGGGSRLFLQSIVFLSTISINQSKGLKASTDRSLTHSPV